MRTILFLFILLFTHLASSSQDLDYPDYRSKKDNFVKVREKDIRNELAAFTNAGLDESMNKTPLKSIPITGFGTNYISFSGNGIKVTIRTAPFDPAKHKLNYYEEHLLKIDGKPDYGHYGELPKVVISAVTITVNNDTVPVPAAAFADIYDPGFSYTDGAGAQRSQNRIYLSPDNKTFYIYILDRNNRGTEVTWIIRDKTYLRRIVDFGFLK